MSVRRRRSVLPRVAALLLCAGLLASAGAQDGAPAALVPAAPATSASQPDREIRIAAESFVKDATLPKWVVPATIPDTPPSGPASIALSDSQILLAEQTVEFVDRAIRVDDPSALSSLGRVALPFVPAYQRLVLHRLRILRDGATLDRLADAQVRFLQRETGLEQNLYSGVVTASILVDDLRIGDRLEVAFSTIGTNPVFGATFSGAESWDQPLPIALRRVILNVPVQRTVRWRAQGLLTPAIDAPVERVANGMRSLTFEGRSLAALPIEAALPSGVSVNRYVEFSEYADWNAVAAWAATLFVDREPPSAERIAIVAKLRERATVEERVVGALEFVQSQVRYFSVSLGTSSHRPAAPNAVIARRYGDCKDKALLLVALLRDLGIDSTPVLARLGNRTGFDDRLPTPLVFDHVIVKVDVDGATHWLDATRLGQHGRLARMGQVHEGSEVLVASTSTPALQRIDVPNRDELTRDERIETLTLPKVDGDATLRVAAVQNGVAAEVVRALRGALPQDRLDAGVTSAMEKRYPGAKLIEPVRIDDDLVQNRVTLHYAFTLPKPAKRVGSAWLVPLRADNMMQVFQLPSGAPRRGPVAVRYPVNARYTLDATLPDDVGAAFDPASTTIDDPTFVFTSEATYRGNRSVVDTTMRTVADRVPAARLAALRDDLAKVERAMPGGVVVRDVDLKKNGFLGIGRKDLAATIKGRQKDTVERVTATIAAGRLTGDDLARAHCERGGARLTLGDDADAAADADQAVAVDPNAPDMLLCRGEIRSGLGDFGPAIDDVSRALLMGADAGRVYGLRGRARFHLGRYAEAADDFAKAVGADRDERSTLYNALWRAAALRRLDRPLPEDLLRLAAADPRGAWPRPALAMLAGQLAPDEVAALAARTPGDTAEMNGTEADFYAGEYWLSRGDAAKARDAFRSARARGVIVYVEYLAAGIELAKLDRAAR